MQDFDLQLFIFFLCVTTLDLVHLFGQSSNLCVLCVSKFWKHRGTENTEEEVLTEYSLCEGEQVPPLGNSKKYKQLWIKRLRQEMKITCKLPLGSL